MKFKVGRGSGVWLDDWTTGWLGRLDRQWRNS